MNPVRALSRAAFENLARVFGAGAGAALFWWALGNVDLREAFHAGGRLGWRLGWVLVPSVAAVLLDVAAWKGAFRKAGVRAPYAGLLRVRIETEWLANAFPLGALWGEVLKPTLLAARCGLSLPNGIAGLLARKYLLLASQAGYLLVGAIGIFPLLAAKVGGSRVVIVLGLGSTVAVLLVLAEWMRAVLGRGMLLTRLVAALSRSASKTARAIGRRLSLKASLTDDETQRVFAVARHEFAGPVALCLTGWLLEGTETWLIFHLLGAKIPWSMAVGAEAFVVLIRHLLVFLPGGIGAQEFGYAFLLSASTGGISVCASFVLLKRIKELAWIGLGVLLLLSERFWPASAVSVSTADDRAGESQISARGAPASVPEAV